MEVSSASPTRTTVLALAGGLLLAAVLLVVVSGLVAVGEATTHAREHATVVAFAAVVFTLVGLLIRPPTSSSVARVWRAVLIAFAFLAVVQLVEGVGAIGYDKLNEGTRYSWLVGIHFVGVLATLAGYLAVFVSLIVSCIWLVTHTVRSLRSA